MVRKRRISAAAMLIAWAAAGLAQPPATQPATRPALDAQERLNDLFTLIEGPNAPDVRRTGARELILQRWPEAPARLAALLAGTNNSARIAVASALADLPDHLDSAYVGPLLNMLGDADAEVRTAAAGALAAYRNGGVIARLRTVAQDAELPREQRLAAISALGMIPRREAVDALAESLGDSEPPIAQAALLAIERATGFDFKFEIAPARAWWEQTRGLSEERWQQEVIDRLARRNRELRRRLESTEDRLVRVLESAFQRATDSERAAQITTYLGDSALTIRLLGLRLAQLHLVEGKTLSPELQDQIREALRSSDAREQAAAVRTVTSFQAPADAERFLAMLQSAPQWDVMQALINGLGYVGDETAVAPLLELLEQTNDATRTEVVTALGRLAERHVIAADPRGPVTDSLLAVFNRTTPAQVALRERVLWAMSLVAVPAFGPAFAAGVERSEAVAVKLAALRGIAALGDPQLADPLTTVVNDPDPGVRKLAVETLGILGSSENDRHVEALWRFMTSPEETDEGIRVAAAKAVQELLAKRSADQIDTWLARLPGTGADARILARVAEFLERFTRRVQEADTVGRDRLGIVRARLAAVRLLLGQAAEAVATYTAAVEDLTLARHPAAPRVALELLRAAIATGRYDEAVATAVAAGTGGGDAAPVWRTVVTEVEARLKSAPADEVLVLLALLERHPPAPLDADAADLLRRLREQAERVREAAPATAPAKPSETAPRSTAGNGDSQQQ